MSLDNILQALDTEAERQIAEIQQAAGAEIERIRAQAQAEATIARQKQKDAIRATLQAEQARILNKARLESLREVMGTREELIVSAREAAVQQMTEMVGTEAYVGVMQRLTQEAVDKLGSRLQVRTHNRDVDLMHRIVEEMDLSVTIEGGLDHCLGGLVAMNSDGGITLINTLDARLQRVLSLYRPQIAEILFRESAGG